MKHIASSTLLVLALMAPAVQAQTRYIALLAEQAASAEPETSWSPSRHATVLAGDALTRGSAARVLGDKALRKQRVVLFLRGSERLVFTATDLRRWLARSGAAQVAVFVEGGEGFGAWCSQLGDAKGRPLKLSAWCVNTRSPQARDMATWLAGMPADRKRMATLFSGKFDGRFDGSTAR